MSSTVSHSGTRECTLPRCTVPPAVCAPHSSLSLSCVAPKPTHTQSTKQCAGVGLSDGLATEATSAESIHPKRHPARRALTLASSHPFDTRRAGTRWERGSVVRRGGSWRPAPDTRASERAAATATHPTFGRPKPPDEQLAMGSSTRRCVCVRCLSSGCLCAILSCAGDPLPSSSLPPSTLCQRAERTSARAGWVLLLLDSERTEPTATHSGNGAAAAGQETRMLQAT